MYYKIVNKESEAFKKLHELRTNELQIEKDNVSAIESKTGLKFESYLGNTGQQNFWRVTQYSGFKFTEHQKVDLKVWKQDSSHKDIFVPNRKTKLGREMAEFLSNGLKGSTYWKVFEILSIPRPSRFTFPFVEIFGETIGLYLGDEQQPNDENIIEITSKEFETLRG